MITESELRERAYKGDEMAVDQLIESAIERGDIGELRRLSDQGDPFATHQLIELERVWQRRPDTLSVFDGARLVPRGRLAGKIGGHS